jgi:uncharacterized protein YcbX
VTLTKDDVDAAARIERDHRAPVVVSGLFIYPIKSCQGVSVPSANLVGGRLAGDREYMVVSRRGKFMDMRHFPQMARVEANITATGLRLRSAGFPDLEVRAPRIREPEIEHVKIFRRSAPVTSTTVEADQWLSDVLGVSCRLMSFVGDAPALNAPAYEEHASLHDATPFHLTSEESLADLNARARASVPMNRFRPNVVVRGASAYAEDSWKTVAIRDTVLHWVKACTRCVATTTDQLTGERMGREPLATLRTYRRRGLTVVFGHYFMPVRWGAEIRVGDAVSVLARS